MKLEKFALPTEGEKFKLITVRFKYLIIQSFHSSKVTVQAVTSGKLPFAFWMQR